MKDCRDPRANALRQQGGGKGKGKTGSPPRRSRGQALCRTFLKFGECRKDGCMFKHARVPAAIAAIADLVLEDLGECTQDANGVYTPKFPELLDPVRIQGDVVAHIALLNSFSELGGGAADSGEWSLSSASEELGSGFPGQSGQ